MAARPRRSSFRLSVFLALFFVTSIPAALAKSKAHEKTPPKLACLTAPSAKVYALPKSLPVGVETIHRDAQKIITIYSPLAPTGTPSRILNTNIKQASERVSSHYVISDGTVLTAFVGVDATPGGRLDLCLTEILSRIPGSAPEAALTYMRDHLQADFLKEPPKKYVFQWDQDRKSASDELVELYHAAKDMPVGQYPLRSKQTNDVVPLEQFLEAGYGTCLHKALLASLLLTKLNIPHRLVNGATRAVGHAWIELADGRVLDPSLKQLDPLTPAQSLPGWSKYGNTFVFENQVWPFLAFD